MTLLSRLRLMAGMALPNGLTPEKPQEHAPQEFGQVATNLSRLHFCHVLSIHADPAPDAAALKAAWKLLEEQMALVPEGEVVLVPTDPESLGVCDSDPVGDPVWVPSTYLDRYAVTNADYARFVASGGYAQDHLWPPEILSNVLQFVDSTGSAGPRFWTHGRPPANKANHPVVGICWYEANAYAHWCGKRLPTPAEWQRAATWATTPAGGSGVRPLPVGRIVRPQSLQHLEQWHWRHGPGERVLPRAAHPTASTSCWATSGNGPPPCSNATPARTAIASSPNNRSVKSAGVPSTPISPVRPPVCSAPAMPCCTGAITSVSVAASVRTSWSRPPIPMPFLRIKPNHELRNRTSHPVEPLPGRQDQGDVRLLPPGIV